MKNGTPPIRAVLKTRLYSSSARITHPVDLTVSTRTLAATLWLAASVLGLCQMVSLIEWPEFQSTSSSAPQKPAVSASHGTAVSA